MDIAILCSKLVLINQLKLFYFQTKDIYQNAQLAGNDKPLRNLWHWLHYILYSKFFKLGNYPFYEQHMVLHWVIVE